MMADKGFRFSRALLLLLLLLLAAQAALPSALADDAVLLAYLPGHWTLTTYADEVDEAGEPLPLRELAILTLDADGRASLLCQRTNGEYAYTCGGTWTFDLIPDSMDRLTLLFTSTDDPRQEGADYRLECVYDAYSESWEEGDTLHTYLLISQVSASGVTPFEELYEDSSAALERVEGPNRKVVRCKEFVSLREKPSTSSARRAKVPLGAVVLAYPQYGEENGFLFCRYQGVFGYILSEYLDVLD